MFVKIAILNISTKTYTVGLHQLKIYLSSISKHNHFWGPPGLNIFLIRFTYMMSKYSIIPRAYQVGSVTLHQRGGNIISK